MKDETIAKLRDVDISKQDWEQIWLNEIQNLYAQGYLRRVVERLWETIYPRSEEFREEILEFCEHDIWNK